jgi:hypothetical protein
VFGWELEKLILHSSWWGGWGVLLINSSCAFRFDLTIHLLKPLQTSGLASWYMPAGGIKVWQCLADEFVRSCFRPPGPIWLRFFLAKNLQDHRSIEIRADQRTLYTIRVGTVRYSPHSKEPSSFRHSSGAVSTVRCVLCMRISICIGMTSAGSAVGSGSWLDFVACIRSNFQACSQFHSCSAVLQWTTLYQWACVSAVCWNG